MNKLDIYSRVLEVLEEAEFDTQEDLAEILATEILKLDMQDTFDEDVPDEEDELDDLGPGV